MADCRKIKGNGGFSGKQGLSYFAGVAAETAGSKAICMHLLEMPPGVKAKAHLHEDHETAIYVLEGRAEMLYGDELQFSMTAEAGDFVYIPAGVPHLPFNPGATTVRAVVARTDPHEQESVVLCPELDDPIASDA